MKLKDSGKMEDFGNGAHRDSRDGKGRYDLLPFQAISRVAKHYENGAMKYGDNNYRNGMPISRCVDSALRHMFKYLAGWNDEDHLAAAVWNLFAIMYFESEKPEMQDIKEWKGRTNKFAEKGEC